MKGAIVVFTVFLSSLLDEALANTYFWDSYNGKIPEYAFKAGEDERGPFYIGQAPFEDKLIPGKLYEDDDTLYYEMGEQGRTTNKNVKIFCTDEPEIFEWIPTDRWNYNQIKDESLVNGGYEIGFSIHIGRTIPNTKPNVGKVVCRRDNCLALYVNEDGVYKEYHKYEVLSFKTEQNNVANKI